MKNAQIDFSVLNGFDFIFSPVAVKLLTSKPEGMQQLDKSMALCEMVKEAQQRAAPFYITKDNENCAGRATLGMQDPSPIGESGLVGMKFGLFQDPRANSKMNRQSPTISRGVINYVAFSRLDQLTFLPDLLILITTPEQAEIIMRAMSYSTGELWTSKVAMVGACAWLFTYPYQSGNVNYVPTGMTFGMKARKVYPEGLVLMSIPYNWIQTITENLKQMDWILPAFTDSREKFLLRHDRILGELVKEFQNP